MAGEKLSDLRASDVRPSTRNGEFSSNRQIVRTLRLSKNGFGGVAKASRNSFVGKLQNLTANEAGSKSALGMI